MVVIVEVAQHVFLMLARREFAFNKKMLLKDLGTNCSLSEIHSDFFTS